MKPSEFQQGDLVAWRSRSGGPNKNRPYRQMHTNAIVFGIITHSRWHEVSHMWLHHVHWQGSWKNGEEAEYNIMHLTKESE